MQVARGGFAVEVRFSRVFFWANASDIPRCQDNRWVLWEPWHGVCHKTKLPEDALNRQMYGTVRYSHLALVDLHVSIQACECTCRSGQVHFWIDWLIVLDFVKNLVCEMILAIPGTSMFLHGMYFFSTRGFSCRYARSLITRCYHAVTQ